MSEQEMDLTVPEALTRADELLAQSPLVNVFFKFTCEKCGNRLTFDVPNTFYKTGSCDKCGHVTEIKKMGFMAVFGVTAKKLKAVLEG